MRIVIVGGALAAVCGCAHLAAGKPTREPPAPPSAAAAVVDIQPVRRDFDAILPTGLPVAIDNPYGDVRLRFGGYTAALAVHAVLQEPASAQPIELAPTQETGRYLIAPRLPQGAIAAQGQRIDLVVFVPTGHPVSVRTEHGLIESHGIRADVDLQSTAGDISMRGTQGRIQAQTGAGSIEASLNSAPRASRQRLATTTGNIVLAIDDKLDAELELTTSAVFATEYSLSVVPLAGQEPNKKAHTSVGDVKAGKNKAKVVVESRRGEIRLLRRTGFTPLGDKPADEENEDNDSD
ncbi:MAG: hypothetical protein ABIQ70_08170 [Dokdonella sp.]